MTDEHELADVAAMPGDEFMEAELVNDQLASKADELDVVADEIPDAEIVADDNTSAEAVENKPTDEETAGDWEVLDSQTPADIREVADGEEPIAEADAPRVPSADETAEAVRRAQRALIEIQHRREAEERHAAAEASRADELARWHADDTHGALVNTATTTATEPATDNHGPVMELSSRDG